MLAGLQNERYRARQRYPTAQDDSNRAIEHSRSETVLPKHGPTDGRGLDTGTVALCVEADLVVDDHAHAVEPDLPNDLVPIRGGDDTLVLDSVLPVAGSWTGPFIAHSSSG
jgi:hypothetical protein